MAATAPAPGVAGRKPLVTLGGEESSRTTAQRLVSGTDEKLARVDPGRLSSEDRSVYAQAKDFATAAHSALDKQDYAEASGLAQKASVLADKLTPAVPPGPGK